MLKFILAEEKENSVLYKYYPEGGSEFGVVIFDKRSGNGSIEILAGNDRHRKYALKTLKRIREMAGNGLFEKSGMIAWY